MSGAEREMTLAEWVGQLPDFHAASKEYAALARLALAREVLQHVNDTCACARVNIDNITEVLAATEVPK